MMGAELCKEYLNKTLGGTVYNAISTSGSSPLSLARLA